jgi:oxygen-dependent protoporphyrinogen oxidase
MGLIPTRLGSFIRSELFTPWGKLRMGLDWLIPPRRNGHDESLAEFIRRRLGREALERLAEPLLAGVYAADPERLSLLATFSRLRELECQHGSLIRGVLRQHRLRRSSRSAGSGEKPRPVFMTLRGGLSALVDALVAQVQHSVSLRMGQRVVRLERVKAAGYQLTLADGQKLVADAVVLATPAYVTAELLEALSPEAAALLAEIPYASTAVVTLAFRRSEVEHPLDGTGFVVPRVEGRALTACTWSSSKWPERAPEGFVLLRSFFGRSGAEGALKLEDNELIDLALKELRELLGIQGKPFLARVHRWPRAMPQYHVGHLERLAKIENALGEHPEILLAGAAYRGIGLPDCIHQGVQAAERVLQQLLCSESAVPAPGRPYSLERTFRTHRKSDSLRTSSAPGITPNK